MARGRPVKYVRCETLAKLRPTTPRPPQLRVLSYNILAPSFVHEKFNYCKKECVERRWGVCASWHGRAGAGTWMPRTAWK